jgi:hypothetical protein
MEKEKVYLDSTIPSYRVSELSDNALVLIRQKITIDWWENQRHNYKLYISDVVLEEIEEGDLINSKKRLDLVKDAFLLKPKPEIEVTTRKYMDFFNFPEKLYRDMSHVAFSVHYGINFLLTWNFTHLANGHIREQLYRLNERLGLQTPQIVTPEELMESIIERY